MESDFWCELYSESFKFYKCKAFRYILFNVRIDIVTFCLKIKGFKDIEK